MKQFYLIVIFSLALSLTLSSQSAELETTSAKDNTIFKELVLSNGVGEYIFAGTTNLGVVKRALVQFDLTDVPDGVAVDSAFLMLKTVKVKPDSTSLSVHRVLTGWGEGSSKAEDGDGKGAPATAGDATWTHATFPTVLWIKAGGDYEIASSAADTVSLGADAVFSSVKLTLDVNFWLQNPSENYGWIVVGDELNNATSVKFGSKDNIDPAFWPVLKLYYKGTNSVRKETLLKSEMQIFQSANSNSLMVVNPNKPGNARIEIYSITGSRLWESKHNLSTGNNPISAGTLETGIYLYRISLNGKADTGKLLIRNNPYH